MYSYYAFGLNIVSEIELPELSVATPHVTHDLYIRLADIELPKLKNTNIYRRGIRAEFGSDADDNLYLSWKGVANYCAMKGEQLLVSPLTSDPNLLSLFTVSEALGLILFQRNYFLLHASSVQVGNEAWCFMGSPGAGKSTTAAAFVKAGCQLLSDDLTAINFDEGGQAFVVPAYPQLKIWDKTVKGLNYNESDLQPVSEGVNKFSFQPKESFPTEPVKLKEVFFIHKARNVSALKSLSAIEIPTEALKNFPLPTQLLSDEFLRNHFVQSFKCSATANMWRKRRPNGFQLLEKWVEESIASRVLPDQNA